jgi:hypothetical protein
MAYETFRISQDDMNNYYNPLTYRYQKMLDSIGANGYGQLIFNYNGPNDYTFNSFNVWDSSYGAMVIKTSDESVTYTELQAGPNLWGVGSEVGVQFLQGNVSISGLVKLKYCNSCQDRNGLPPTTITSFSNRFSYLKELISENGTDGGYIFYDYSLPVNQRWFPTVYSNKAGTYLFRDYTSSEKDESQLSSEISIPSQDITNSIDSATPIRPVSNTSSVIVNCCNGTTTYIIDGVYSVGTILSTRDTRPYQCYEVVSNSTSRADNFYSWSTFPSDCRTCTTTYGSCR